MNQTVFLLVDTISVQLKEYQLTHPIWILNLMTKPNKPYDTTPRLEWSGYVVRG